MWFLYLAYQPLPFHVTWRHALVGRWISEHGALPSVDPTLPLADGRPWTTTTWLSDVVIYQGEQAAGPLGLTALSSIAIVTASLLALLLAYRATERKRLALAAVFPMLALVWPKLGVLRPELLGASLFVGLLLLLQDVRRRGRLTLTHWIALPVLMCLWANLDGRAVFGAWLLAAWASPRVLSTQTDSRSSERRMEAWWAECGIIATLLQPLGFNLWAQTWKLTTSSLWLELGGPQPLVLASYWGLFCGGLWVLAAIVLRQSDARLETGDLTLLGGASLLTAISVQFAWWLGGVAVVVVWPHVARVALARGWAPAQRAARIADDALQPFHFAYSLVSLLLIWCAFALSPLATPLLGGKPRGIERTFSRETPLGVAKNLRDKPPQGLVWAPDDWSDWLLWDGPPGLKVAANSNGALLPAMVRFDYSLVNRAEGNWTRTLDRYGVQLLVIDKQRQARLTDQAMGQGEDWTIQYEDERALVMRRKEVRG